MASFRGLAVVAGASPTTSALFTEGCLQQQQQSYAARRAGGGYESNKQACCRLSSASSFCGESTGALSSAAAGSKSLAAPLFPSRSNVLAYSAVAGATTTTKEEEEQQQQQYYYSKERRRSSSSFSSVYASSSSSSAARTLYEVLGVSKGASAKEIKLAYRQAARKLHPDVVPAEQREDSTKKFLQIQNAYNVLSEDESRAAYDWQLLSAVVQSSARAAPISMASSNWGFTTTAAAASSGSSPYPAADFASAFKGRSWETDQCW